MAAEVEAAMIRRTSRPNCRASEPLLNVERVTLDDVFFCMSRAQ
jgi:hypothetical protein